MALEQGPPDNEVNRHQLVGMLALLAIEVVDVELAPVIIGIGLVQVVHQVAIDPPIETLQLLTNREYQKAAGSSASYATKIFKRVVDNGNIFSTIVEQSGAIGRTVLRSTQSLLGES